MEVTDQRTHLLLVVTHSFLSLPSHAGSLQPCHVAKRNGCTLKHTTQSPSDDDVAAPPMMINLKNIETATVFDIAVFTLRF